MTQQYCEHLLEAGEKPKPRPSWRWPLLGLAFLLLLLLVGMARFLTRFPPVAGKEGMNYLYISFHGDGSGESPLPEYGVNQILRFNLEYPEERPLAVLDSSASPTPPRMLRDILAVNGTLFVAQGLKFDSCILQYGPCDATGVREFQKEYRSPILVHPYALTLLGRWLNFTSYPMTAQQNTSF